MQRRTFLKAVAGTVGGMALTGGSLVSGAMDGTQSKRAVRPNLVFVLGEGLRPDELSSGGNKVIHTPNLDRIAHEGMTFKNSFCTNALCLPSRATILTGLYSHTTGAVDNQHSKIPSDVPILPDLLREAGYEVAFIGKSHVEGALLDHYWDYYFGFTGQVDYYKPVLHEGVKGKVGPPKEYSGYVDDILTDKAVEWLGQEHEKPFCLFLWLYAPHAPFYRPRRLVNALNGVAIPKPNSFDDWEKGYPGKPKCFVDADNKIGLSQVGWDDPRSLEEVVKNQYVGVLSNDEDMGRIFDVLEKKKCLDETAIILSSDHGFFLGEFGLYDKRLMHEPSIRVPLIIRYPKLIKQGSTSDKMALNVDVAPTILDLAGAPVPKSMQGRSLMPLLLGNQVTDWRKDWLYEYYEYPGYENVKPNRGIRTERYKLIHYFTSPEEFELYDLQTDPDERHNLYGDTKHKALSDQLWNRMQELRKETGDHYEYSPTVLLDSQTEKLPKSTGAQ
jgi:arylsulfatase A-like enzyme